MEDLRVPASVFHMVASASVALNAIERDQQALRARLAEVEAAEQAVRLGVLTAIREDHQIELVKFPRVEKRPDGYYLVGVGVGTCTGSR